MTPLWRNVLIALASLLVLGVLGVAAIVVLIRTGLQRYSEEAVAQFPGDRNRALIAMLDCTTCDMQARNHAAWALGQMAVDPALPVLKKHFDGKPCTHETRLCQKELGKAIRMIETRRQRAGPMWQLVGRLHQPWN
jgi:hypothetical protein